jgi:hypothetical protein
MAGHDMTPIRTIRTVGWCAVTVAITVITSECISLFFADPLGKLNSLLRMIPHRNLEAFNVSTSILRFGWIWSVYTTVYFAFVITAAIQLIRLNEAGRKMLLCAAGVGILTGCAGAYLSCAFWKTLQRILSNAAGSTGLPPVNMNPSGPTSIIGSFILWILPSIALIVFLQRPAVNASTKKVKGNTAVPKSHLRL